MADQNTQQLAQQHREAAQQHQMAADHCERAAKAYESGDSKEGQRLAQESEKHASQARQAMRKGQPQQS